MKDESNLLTPQAKRTSINTPLQIRKAGVSDLDLLIKLRLDYLRTDKGNLTQQEEEAITNQLQAYFKKHLPLGDFIALYAQIGGETASAAFLVITEKPANPAFITGMTGTLLNIITYDPHRRKGISTKVIQHLIEEAKKAGVTSLDLSATQDGKPMYEKLGFTTPDYTAMSLKL